MNIEDDDGMLDHSMIDGSMIDGSMPDSRIDDRMRWALRDLRRDLAPQRDLWPQIAARIEAGGSTAVSRAAQRSRPRRFASLALAASLLLAIGVVWRLQPAPTPAQPTAGLIRVEAHAMTREYNAALRELEASAPSSNAVQQPALRDLDRSAAQIRTALARDPDARFLLERLRHTYSLRLALTQRAALG